MRVLFDSGAYGKRFLKNLAKSGVFTAEELGLTDRDFDDEDYEDMRRRAEDRRCK